VGAVLHPEGRNDGLTITAADPVSDGPGWRLRFREIPDRTAAEPLRGVYLEAVVPATETPARGEYYWHEVIGVPVTDVAGTVLGTVRDVYRAGGAEVFVVDGGPVGSFDVPAVRAFIRIFAPRRGEIVVDADALDLRVPKRGEEASS
jgi:16S rRNA processing protein RimM